MVIVKLRGKSPDNGSPQIANCTEAAKAVKSPFQPWDTSKYMSFTFIMSLYKNLSILRLRL